MHIDRNHLRSFASRIRGRILGPNDPGFDDLRKVWNGMIDKRPAAILRCGSVSDIREGINLARDRHLQIAVRGGGHNVAGHAVCEGGLVLDLSSLKAVRIDPVRRMATAEAGSTWRDYDEATQAHGFASPGGVVSTTGIAGLTLGGGVGYLSRAHGLACDHLLSVDVVTVEGRMVRASPDEEPDLFWGLRGGGGNFGIATSFTYRLHPLHGVYGGILAFPIERAAAVLRVYREVTLSAPDCLTAYASLLNGPEGKPSVAVVVCYSGKPDDGARWVHPFRSLGGLALDTVTTVSYGTLQQQLDAAFPAGRRNYWKSSYVHAVEDDLIAGLMERFARVPSPHSQILIEHLGGAIGRVARLDAAFDHREATYNILILSAWTERGEDAVHQEWARASWTALAPFSTGGVYVNYLGAEEASRITEGYRPEKLERLIALKRRYDPQNFFRVNQNIAPASPAAK